jgi:hypothetical protein
VDLSYDELEVKDFGIIDMECFKFNLQKLKLIILDWMWKENGK